jgi:hypothetical protein
MRQKNEKKQGLKSRDTVSLNWNCTVSASQFQIVIIFVCFSLFFRFSNKKPSIAHISVFLSGFGKLRPKSRNKSRNIALKHITLNPKNIKILGLIHGEVGQIVLAGDHKQLGPVLQSQAARYCYLLQILLPNSRVSTEINFVGIVSGILIEINFDGRRNFWSI